MISACALALSITTITFQIHNWNLQQENWSLQQENDRLQRLHDQLSATPAIQLLASTVPSKSLSRIGLFLLNYGGGAALMKELSISVDGVSAASIESIVETLQRAIDETGDAEEWKSIVYTPSGFDVLPPGGEQMLLEFPQEAWTPERAKILRDFFARMSIKVSYESIYGEADTKTFTPYRRIDSTEASE